MMEKEPVTHWGRWWRWILMGGLLLILGGVLLVLGWSERAVLMAYLESSREVLVSWIQTVPLPLFILAFAVGPVVGFPLTLFYLTTGAVTGNLFGSLILVWICLFFNMLFSYGIARSWLHPVIERAVRRRGLRIPVVPPQHEWKLIVTVRVSPMPWVFQNYLLSLAGARLIPYLVVSMLVQAPIGAGMVIVGESLLSGKARFAFVGLFLVLLVSFAFSLLRRRLVPSDRNAAPVA